MSLKIRFRFDGKCSRHPRYNPRRDGRPADGKCDGCESLYVVHLYTTIAQKKARNLTGIVAQVSVGHEEQRANHDLASAGAEESA